MRFRFYISALLILLTGFVSLGQNNIYLDTTFNPAGPVKGKLSINYSPQDRGSAAITDPAGRLLTVAYDTAARRIFVSRFRIDGSFDSFGSLGTYTNTYTVGQSAYCLALQPDGKILVGGGRRTGIGSNPMRAFLFRLNQDGTLDAGFGEQTYDFGGGTSQEIKAIEVLSNGNIIIGGTSDNSIFVARVRANGALDTGFNSPNGYVTKSELSLKWGGMAVNANNEILFAGNQIQSIARIYLYKLRDNGSADISFNNTGADTLTYNSVFNYSAGLKFLPNGSFVMGVGNSNEYKLLKFLPNGLPDNFSINSSEVSVFVYGASVTNLLIDTKGNFILTGLASNYDFCAIRFNSSGIVDSTFGFNGRITDYVSIDAKCNGSCITPEGKVVLIGHDNTPNTMIYRLENRPVFHMIGNDIVLPKSAEKYEVQVPGSWPATYTYQWDYSGTNSYFFSGNTGKNILIYYSEDATGGILKCTARNQSGITMGTVWINVKLNNNASQANLLAEVQCPRQVTDCYNNYINSFQLDYIHNNSTSCNSTGYTDFTKSSYSDTLIAGAVYTAKIIAESPEPLKYAAMWIDYNNDGIFNSSDEFIQQVSGPGPMLSFNNIILKNQEEYTGPKRMRIRCSPYPFTPSLACQSAGEIGETEDYMIIIKSHDGLKAPGIITPNDDGKNDYFVIRGIDPKVDNKLTIMDRYGNVVFTTSKYENNWDGKDASGSKVNPGTYYYYFDNNGENIRGFIEVRY